MGIKRSVEDFDVDKFSKYLQNNDIDPKKLAEEIGASSNYVRNIVAGTSSVSLLGYRAICNALQVPESLFVRESETAVETEGVQLDRIEHKLDTILRRLGC